MGKTGNLKMRRPRCETGIGKLNPCKAICSRREGKRLDDGGRGKGAHGGRNQTTTKYKYKLA